DELIGYQEQFLTDHKLEQEIDRMLEAHKTPEALSKSANERFMLATTPKEIESWMNGSAVDSSSDGEAISLRDHLLDYGRRFLRKELTDLEQFVLINIFDQSWKDHLYAMDMLKAGIGLQAFAERDPRIAYKKEGYAYFEQMMAGIRDKVTDLIFRARIGRAAPEPRSNYKISEASTRSRRI